MPLACGCDDYADYEDAAWYYMGNKYTTLPGKRRKRCCSCKTPLSPGVDVLSHARARMPNDEIESRIYGEDEPQVPLAPYYQCARCAGIFLSLQELGFCMDPTDNMDSLLAEYHRDYAKPPAPGFELKIKGD